MPTTIVIDGVTLTLKKYPEFVAGVPIATDITLFSDPVNGDLFKTTMDNLIANILNVDGVTITGDGSSGSPLVSSGGGATASEGLIAVASDVRLGDTSGPGATITVDRYIDLGTNTLFFTGVRATTNPVLRVENTATFGEAIRSVSDIGVAIQGLSTGGYGVKGNSTNGPGGSFFSDTVSGVEGISTTGLGGYFQMQPASTNTAIDVIKVVRLSSGTAANGLGARINYTLQTSDGSSQDAGFITFQWQDATTGTRTSQATLRGVLSGSTVDLIGLNADGSWQMRPITAASASAITPAEGMIVFTSDTDGTFTSIGFWGYRNGAWAAF